jgi:hypothetical protein
MNEPRRLSRTVRRAHRGRRPSEGLGRGGPGSRSSRGLGEGSSVAPLVSAASALRADGCEVTRRRHGVRGRKRKNRLGGYPGRSSNAAPDEGDGTRTARGFPPAWHSRPYPAQTSPWGEQERQRACGCRGFRADRRRRGRQPDRSRSRRGCRAGSAHRPDARAAHRGRRAHERRARTPQRPQDLARRTLGGARTGAPAPAFPTSCSGGRGTRDAYRAGAVSYGERGCL